MDNYQSEYYEEVIASEYTARDYEEHQILLLAEKYDNLRDFCKHNPISYANACHIQIVPALCDYFCSRSSL